jgi:hypothetical protein
MRVNEIYEAVSKLGFEDSLEDNIAFYHALNRATVQINDLRPMIGAIEIFHKPLVNCIKDSFTVREVFQKVDFSAIGAKAYYFEVKGLGRYAIKYKKDEEYITVKEDDFQHSVFTPKFGFITSEDGKPIDGETILEIKSDYAIYIRNVALYDKLYGPAVNDIPAYTEYTPYDISDLAEDFLALAERPIEMNGHIVMNTGYEIENGRVILLPRDNPGIYKIRYKKLVQSIEYEPSPAEDERDIPLDGDLCQLLPLLIASYVWIDDEPSKAQYYLNLYTVRAREIVAAKSNVSPLKYDTNGW